MSKAGSLLGLTSSTNLLEGQSIDAEAEAIVSEMFRPGFGGLTQSGFLARGSVDSAADAVAQVSCGGVWVLEPSSRAKLVWDVLTLFFVMYEMCVTPFEAFVTDSVSPPGMALAKIVFWTLDFGVSFRTGVYLGAELVMSPKRIAQHYVRRWFILDLALLSHMYASMMSFGGDWSRSAYGARVLRAVRLSRLLRVFKVARLLYAFALRTNSLFASLALELFQAVLGLTSITHWVACVWYYVGAYTSEDGWAAGIGTQGDVDVYHGSSPELAGPMLCARRVVACQGASRSWMPRGANQLAQATSVGEGGRQRSECWTELYGRGTRTRSGTAGYSPRSPRSQHGSFCLLIRQTASPGTSSRAGPQVPSLEAVHMCAQIVGEWRGQSLPSPGNPVSASRAKSLVTSGGRICTRKC